MSQQATMDAINETTIKNWLVTWIAKELELPESEINTSNSLLEYSLSSMTAMMLVGDLEEWLKIEIVPTLVWDYPSIDALVEYLSEEANNSAPNNNGQSDTVTSLEEANIDELSEAEVDALLAKLNG